MKRKSVAAIACSILCLAVGAGTAAASTWPKHLHAREIALIAHYAFDGRNDPGILSDCHVAGLRNHQEECTVTFTVIAQPSDTAGYATATIKAIWSSWWSQCYLVRVGGWTYTLDFPVS